MRTLLRPGEQTELITLSLHDVDAGGVFDLDCQDETVVVVLGGTVDVTVDGSSLGSAGGRADVFEGPGHSVYVPPGSALRLASPQGAQLALASAPVEGAETGAARVIGPDDQRIADVGEGNWARSVRTILGPEHAAGRLLLGETINPPGNWSSYPPHKHDTDDPPREVKLEEVYLFKIDPAGGFGVQMRYGDGPEQCFIVHEHDTAAIPAGYHPVVAAPGYSLYYLWAMAGVGRQMAPYFDPAHAWVQQPL